jgi:hypothetical protein
MIDRRSFLVGAVSTGTAAAFGVDAFGPLSGIRSTSGAKRPLALVVPRAGVVSGHSCGTLNAADDHHPIVAGWLDGADDDLATTPLIVAEVDHLVGARGGPTARRALHRDLAAGAYLVEWWPGAIASVVKIAERYADTR